MAVEQTVELSDLSFCHNDKAKGTILVYGDCDFSHFFDMAAHLNPIATSCYHSIVGLTNLTPVIQTQTFDQYK